MTGDPHAVGTEHAAADPWEGILEDGEEILWQGQPDARRWMEGKGVVTVLIFVFIICATLYTPVTEIRASGRSLSEFAREAPNFWPFALIILAVIAYFLSGIYKDWREHRTKWYTLTDRRAFIAMVERRSGPSLRHYWLHPQREITLKDTNPPSVIFEVETVNQGDRIRRREIGFKHIEEAGKVIEIMRKNQANYHETQT